MRHKIIRSKTVLAMALVLILTLAACGGGGGDSATPTAPPTPTLVPGETPNPTPTPTPTPTIPPENRAPTADFTFEPESVPRGDNHQTIVTLTATASDPDGDQLTFEWVIFGGRPSTADGQVVTTTFPGRAPYRVTLTISDGRGGTVTVQKTVPLG